MEDLQTGRPAAEIDGSGHTAAHESPGYLGHTPQWRDPCITSQWATPWVKDVPAQTIEGIAMSTTTERILIAIFLIVAVLLAMRDAHAGMDQSARTERAAARSEAYVMTIFLSRRGTALFLTSAAAETSIRALRRRAITGKPESSRDCSISGGQKRS